MLSVSLSESLAALPVIRRWCSQGYPVYGPFGYATASNALSGVTRMTTGYRLKVCGPGTHSFCPSRPAAAAGLTVAVLLPVRWNFFVLAFVL